MIFDQNLTAIIQFIDLTYSDRLFVMANIYDCTNEDFVLEGTVNLMQLNGGLYIGKYRFQPNRLYVVQKLVYTDESYRTIDKLYPQDLEQIWV